MSLLPVPYFIIEGAKTQVKKIKEADWLQSQGRGSPQVPNLKSSGKMENLSDAIRGILTAQTFNNRIPLKS